MTEETQTMAALAQYKDSITDAKHVKISQHKQEDIINMYRHLHISHQHLQSGHSHVCAHQHTQLEMFHFHYKPCHQAVLEDHLPFQTEYQIWE